MCLATLGIRDTLSRRGRAFNRCWAGLTPRRVSAASLVNEPGDCDVGSAGAQRNGVRAFRHIIKIVITRSLKRPEIRGNACRLLSLQHAAYAVEADLIEDARIPPLHESEDDLVSAPLLWIATFDTDLIVGAVGYTIENDVVDIDPLMIDPDYHRQGLGTTLVTTVAGRAEKAIVSTGMKNTPARNLYESLGFIHDTNIEPVTGLWVSQYSLLRHPVAPVS